MAEYLNGHLIEGDTQTPNKHARKDSGSSNFFIVKSHQGKQVKTAMSSQQELTRLLKIKWRPTSSMLVDCGTGGMPRCHWWEDNLKKIAVGKSHHVLQQVNMHLLHNPEIPHCSMARGEMRAHLHKEAGLATSTAQVSICRVNSRMCRDVIQHLRWDTCWDVHCKASQTCTNEGNFAQVYTLKYSLYEALK